MCYSDKLIGPFELMKNTAQVGHEMAKKDPTRAFNTVGQKYAGKGTIRIAKEIVTQHGPLGLWKGVRLHMGIFPNAVGFHHRGNTVC